MAIFEKKNGKQNVEVVISDKKHYDFDEALELAGNGRYNRRLLATLSLTILAMGVDMFGFSVVVAGATCDLNLDVQQQSILISMPFVGAIFTAYPWGYISDTKGRQKSLFVATTISFICSTISAFSPHWIVLALLKFISVSFCSCAQSVSYALIGESCTPRVKGTYMLIMTSTLMLTQLTYFVPGYFILNLKFSYSLGFISFLPWRLLVLVIALPLGLSAYFITYFYESPKFLLNDGREEEALDCLRNIYVRNGGDSDKYPVQNLVLHEDGNRKNKDIPLLRSMWDQLATLFKPPLLWRSLQLYFLTAVIYSTNNSFLMWFPFLVNAFFSSLSSADENQATGLCNMIMSKNNVTVKEVACNSSLDFRTSMSSICHSIAFCIFTLIISQLSSRKKAVMLTLFLISGVAGICTVLISSNAISFLLFFVYQMIGLCIGLVFSYFIDLYPTSHRGMAACLGVMVARGSALGGINLLGAFVMTHCSHAFFICSGVIFSGLFVALFLPSDKLKKAG